MCHRQDIGQSQKHIGGRGEAIYTYVRRELVKGEKEKKIPRYRLCIPTSSVRLVVRDNGGTDKALFVGER